jgi:hypothetical protein
MENKNADLIILMYDEAVPLMDLMEVLVLVLVRAFVCDNRATVPRQILGL